MKSVLVLCLCLLHSSLMQRVSAENTKRDIQMPIITLESINVVIVRENETFELPCEVPGPHRYSWTWKDNNYNPSNTEDGVTMQEGVGTLVFNRANLQVAGSYECVAVNDAGATTIKLFDVSFANLDSFPDKPVNNLDVVVGQTLKLDCSPPQGHPPPSVYWAFESLQPVELNDRVSVDPNGSLILSNVLPEDERDGAIYYCVAYNSILRSFEKGEPTRLTVSSDSS